VTPFEALNRNPSNPAAWTAAKEEKSTFEKSTKNLDSNVKPRKHKNHSDVAGSGSVNVGRPINNHHTKIIPTWQVPAR
jgi:hypothetical protein